MVFRPEIFSRLIKSNENLCLLAKLFPTKEILKVSFKKEDILAKLIKEKAESLPEKAYTRAGLVGLFAHTILPNEISDHTGNYLDRKSGAQVALTNKLASQMATAERERQQLIEVE